jgi:uncharacterized protein (TIGR02996 family)
VRQAFLDAIVSAPEDDTPRLVFADWLDENGEPERAEFIRAQCALARLSAEDRPLAALSCRDPRRDELEDRQEILRTRHAKDWLDDLPFRPVNGRFYEEERIWQRGFVGEIQITAADFLAHADQLFRVAPVTSVWLEQAERRARALAASPYLERLRVLDLDDCGLFEAGVRRLLSSPHLTNLSELALPSADRDGGATVRLVAGSPHFRGLRALALGWRNLRTGDIRAVVGSPHLSRLKQLVLDGNELNESAVHALLGGEEGPEFEALDLRRTAFGDPMARALARAPRAASLKDLNLCCNPLAADGLRALADCPLLSGLESLWLGETDLSPAGLAALASSPHLENVRRLWLDNNQFGGGHSVAVGPEGAVALASGDNLRLAALHLNDHALGHRGARALADWAGLRSVHTLYLGRNGIGDEGAMAIAASAYMTQLTHLYLGNNDIGDEGMIALAESGHLGRLRTLEIQDNRIGRKGIEALASSGGMANLRVLNLGSNPVGDGGAVALGRSDTLPRLHTVWLGECGIGNVGGTALAHSARLRDVIFLLLFHNRMKEATRAALRDRFGDAVRI